MSALRFDVHMDKENATPAPIAYKGGLLKNAGFRDSNEKVFQPTPRKALFDVNQGPGKVTASRGLGKGELESEKAGSKCGPMPSLKASAKTTGAEVTHMSTQNKKPDTKITPVIHQKELKVLKDTDIFPPKKKFAVEQKTKKMTFKQQQPKQEVTDEEYDSDSIFPRTERLSSYVDKLLNCRLPCLFGPVLNHDESDNSDVEEELPLNSFVLEMSPFVHQVPEFSDTDLLNLMEDLPPPIPDSEDCGKVVYQDRDS